MVRKKKRDDERKISKLIALGICLSFLVSIFFSTDLANKYVGKLTDTLGAAFFSLGLQVNDLVKKYALAGTENLENPKIKILLVAGHEPDFGGAEYGKLKERDLNLQLALKLRERLEKNPKFEVVMARDVDGWNPSLSSFVYSKNKEINAWVKGMKQEMSRLVEKGQVTMVRVQVGHPNAPPSSVLFLYGINKWATENKIDIAVHIHFNDNPKYKGKPNFEGFSIYVPESQYSNSLSSKVLAKDLFDGIKTVQKVSTMVQESGGIIEDQELIALGSFNTSDALSVLIEYAYIYESYLQYGITRNFFLDDAASSTARSLEHFFESRISDLAIDREKGE